MSHQGQTITLWGPTAFVLSVMLIATPFVSYYSQTAIMYKITPTGCDGTLYTNESSWYLGPWVIIPAYGVCPKETYAYHPMTGYGYHDCMAFNEKPKWVDMDEANDAAGYHTYMKNGANAWLKADECLIIGTIFLFLIPFAVIGLGSGEDDEQVLVLFTLLIAVPVSFVVTLVMFFSVQQTYQVKPEAWAMSIFESCNVTIETTYGLYLIMYVIAVCGVLVVVSYGGLGYFAYIEWRRYLDDLAQLEADNPPPTGPTAGGSSGSGSSRGPGQASSSSSETQSLLVPGSGGGTDDTGRRKQKKNTYYQTAVAYRQGIDDYYHLPSAPATAVPITNAIAEEDEWVSDDDA
jgi:hypothetical protein